MTESTHTIHEALAEIRLCEKKLDHHREFIVENQMRVVDFVDPLASSGGTEKAVLKSTQAMSDLGERLDVSQLPTMLLERQHPL